MSTTSQTYNFNPSLGETVLYAYNLIEVRSTALAQEHFESARMATNMLLVGWANRGVNLWAVDLQTVTFLQTPATLTASGTGSVATLTFATPNTPIYTVGNYITVSGVTPTGYNGTYVVTASSAGSVSYANTTTGNQTVSGTISTTSPSATYSVDPSTVVILDAYVSTNNITASPTTTVSTIDRIILPVSRTEYASYSNKAQVGIPTVFWFDRLNSAARTTGSIGPSITLYLVPDGTSSQYLNYYRLRQLQDAALTGGQTVDIPYLWLDAFAFALAYRLALIYNAPKATMLKALADEAYQIAANRNVESSSVYISPQIASYWR